MSVRTAGFRSGLILTIVAVLFGVNAALAQETLPIGVIQGRGSESAYLDQMVRFRGIVTGILEDENSQGTRFYTVFVQDLPGMDDGDPLTSDGIAIFVGARRPSLAVGDVAAFHGRVTEFYGLSEVDNNDLFYTIESRNNPLPEPIEINPPADNAQAARYLERFEAMRVSMPASRVVGPAHVGCGFHVVRADSGLERIIINDAEDPVGQIVGALHFSDVDCQAMPDVAWGDEVDGLVGPLTYHFERFKIVYQDPAVMRVRGYDEDVAPDLAEAPASGYTIASFNVENYFDTRKDTGHDAEPQLSEIESTLKRNKVAATVGVALRCPAILGLQEVENADLLADLAERLESYCGFIYQISHIESPDARGAEAALMSNPAEFALGQIQLRQGCTDLDTGIVDPAVTCPAGAQPLFSRPPLQVSGSLDGHAVILFVNHFKSKRGGVQETAARRLAQAEHLRQLIEEIQIDDPDANIVVLGDFNDYDGSELMARLSGEQALVDALQAVPHDRRYSYIFDGAAQLIDWILVSPPVIDYVVAADVVHTNADYSFRMADRADEAFLAYRSSDHDIPYIVVDFDAGVQPAATELAPSVAPVQPETMPGQTIVTPVARAIPTRAGLDIDAPEPDGGAAATAVAVTPTVSARTQTPTTGEMDEEGPPAWLPVLAMGLIVAAAAAVIYRRLGRCVCPGRRGR